MTVDVKICGLSTPETLDAAISAGAAFAGLMFFARSPRNVSIADAATLAKRARDKIKIVAVTVDADDELLNQITKSVNPDYFQAHGHETLDRISQIHQMTGKPVIKAVQVSTVEDVQNSANYAQSAAFLLYDAKAPETLKSALPGGNGLAFDWGLLAGLSGGFMLSGGLTPENVTAAIQQTGTSMVDVSSGVESSPGVKDIALIRKFIETAKSAR